MKTHLQHIIVIGLLFASVVGSGGARAMGCPQTEYNLRTQAMVDAFPQNCDSVLGDMIVEGSDITNVDALANLTSVGDGLKIRGNSSLTNIDALANLTSVGGALNINSNAALTNIDGLANLTKVVQGLEINSNASLTNIDGLANVAGSTSGILEINNNAALTNIDGLANLTRVAGFLKIQGNAALTNLDGLASLTSVGGDLLISGNDNASCEGLALLLGWPSGPPDDDVAGDITIVSNGSGCNSIAEVLASYTSPITPPATPSDRFNALLQAVQAIRGAGGSQQAQATSESSAEAGVARQLAKQEGAIVQAKAAGKAGEPTSIQTMPYYLTLMLACLAGLLGLRQLRV